MIFDPLEDVLNYLYQKVMDVSRTVIDWLLQYWNQYIVGTWQKLGQIWDTVWDFTSEWWVKIVAWVQATAVWVRDQTVEKVWPMIQGATETFTSAFGDWAVNTVDRITGFPAAVVELFTEKIPDILSKVGWYLADSLVYMGTAGLLERYPRTPEDWAEFRGKVEGAWGWVVTEVNDRIEGVIGGVTSWIAAQGVIRPEMGLESARGLMRVGFAAVAGLTGMVLASETIGFWKHLGLGQISAVIWDATQFRLITGAFMGALAFFALRVPLQYYFRDLFRPNLLEPRDFMELMSRKAFERPEVLMPPAEAEAFNRAMEVDGSTFISRMLGFYGYRSEMEPFYRELSNSRLGYFALAAVARFGMFDEAWYRESLSRAGYSERVKDQLINVYGQMAIQAGRGKFLTAAQRGYRDGWLTADALRGQLAGWGFGADMVEGVIDGVDFQADLELRNQVASLVLRAYARGIVSEGEARGMLTDMGMDGARASLSLLQEKMGLLPRVRLSMEGIEEVPYQPAEVVEEGEAW